MQYRLVSMLAAGVLVAVSNGLPIAAPEVCRHYLVLGKTPLD